MPDFELFSNNVLRSSKSTNRCPVPSSRLALVAPLGSARDSLGRARVVSRRRRVVVIFS